MNFSGISEVKRLWTSNKSSSRCAFLTATGPLFNEVGSSEESPNNALRKARQNLKPVAIGAEPWADLGSRRRHPVTVFNATEGGLKGSLANVATVKPKPTDSRIRQSLDSDVETKAKETPPENVSGVPETRSTLTANMQQDDKRHVGLDGYKSGCTFREWEKAQTEALLQAIMSATIECEATQAERTKPRYQRLLVPNRSTEAIKSKLEEVLKEYETTIWKFNVLVSMFVNLCHLLGGCISEKHERQQCDILEYFKRTFSGYETATEANIVNMIMRKANRFHLEYWKMIKIVSVARPRAVNMVCENFLNFQKAQNEVTSIDSGHNERYINEFLIREFLNARCDLLEADINYGIEPRFEGHRADPSKSASYVPESPPFHPTWAAFVRVLSPTNWKLLVDTSAEQCSLDELSRLKYTREGDLEPLSKAYQDDETVEGYISWLSQDDKERECLKSKYDELMNLCYDNALTANVLGLSSREDCPLNDTITKRMEHIAKQVKEGVSYEIGNRKKKKDRKSRLRRFRNKECTDYVENPR